MLLYLVGKSVSSWVVYLLKVVTRTVCPGAGDPVAPVHVLLLLLVLSSILLVGMSSSWVRCTTP